MLQVQQLKVCISKAEVSKVEVSITSEASKTSNEVSSTNDSKIDTSEDFKVETSKIGAVKVTDDAFNVEGSLKLISFQG